MNPEDSKDKRATDAMVIENVNGLKMNDLTIRWAEYETEAKWKSALTLKNVTDFELRSFSGRQGLKEGNDPAIVLENISDGLIVESRAEAGCSTFIQMRKEEKGDLTLRNNNVIKAKKDISYIG
jgi:hypothetical protein